MGSSTSVCLPAPPSIATRAGDVDLKDGGATEEGPGDEEEDVFSKNEVAKLLTAIFDADSEQEDVKVLIDGYRQSFVKNFCGGDLEDDTTSGALIRRSTILNLSPDILDLYLHNRVGVNNSVHRQLMCGYITCYGNVERSTKESAAADFAEANITRTPGEERVIELSNAQDETTRPQLSKRPAATGTRKTLRFITKIDMSERRITCIRRTVLPSDCAISHRWQARPAYPQWVITRHTHTESCWMDSEECPCPYIDYEPCALSDEDLYCNYILKDWTVVCSCEENIGGRVLSYPDRSYKCSLTMNEVNNLSALIVSKASLWCDYICINQADPCDKMEQIPLMGNLYFTARTLILGADLASCIPPDDYLFRAWCMQEINYGAIECPWDFNSPSCDRLSLRQFVSEALKRIPACATAVKVGKANCGVQLDLRRHAAHGSNLCAVFEYVRYFNFENEPINEMTPEKISSFSEVIQQLFRGHLLVLYPQYKTQFLNVIEELNNLIRNNKTYDEDDVHISRCFLKLREIISCPLEVEPLTCQFQVFDSQAACIEDRIYALWGVPMWMRKQQQLPYPNHKEALRLIYKAYPSAEFAFYRGGSSRSFVSFTYFTQVQDLLLHFLTNGESIAKAFPCVYHAYFISSEIPSPTAESSSTEPLLLSKSIIIAVNDHFIGVGLKEAHQENDQASMWVVFSKSVMQLLFDSDIDIFCMLCFKYILYQVGLFNNDNCTERRNLYKFCCQFK